MSVRQKIPKSIETNLLLASGRRCCLCVFLLRRDEVRKGQIAHLNHDPSDFSFDNLAWLCLEHHDEYDSRTSQSKGFTLPEIKAYRDRLYARTPESADKAADEISLVNPPELQPLQSLPELDRARERFPKKLAFLDEPWRYPLWQVANQPELFAFKSRNRADGICLIERIDLPDGRIVVACIAIEGNPGISITNGVEDLCFQVCERFSISPARLIWLEHYEDEAMLDGVWRLVTFEGCPPESTFEGPHWNTVTPDMRRTLRLRPKKRLVRRDGQWQSKLSKKFHWPTEAIV